MSPRGVLRRVIERAERLGYQPIAAYEFEFYLFEGSPRELARRHWRDLEPTTVHYFVLDGRDAIACLRVLTDAEPEHRDGTADQKSQNKLLLEAEKCRDPHETSPYLVDFQGADSQEPSGSEFPSTWN